ncbi:hypothetical protein [Agromyces sp. Leaf222]|uniref:hypothetical protein n=1 Tax=Agromyces sp. Leaf222 TaxID=1735688 RepID=UPI0006F87D9E|nr:hypothetical protein [Agromyces sp. Leaf222]KQM81255.1 hypothetical protein ASE68_15810 [Agromyces sp. Leaf222]
MPARTQRRLVATWSTGFAAIAIGMLCSLIGIAALEGVARGVLIGAGVALTLVGTVVLASTLGWLASRSRSGEVQGWWLPSRDGDR